MRLQGPQIAKTSFPGQFVNIKVNQEFIPLLRKPFSVCRRNSAEGWFEVLWKVVGKGTKIMSGLRPGDWVNVIGPLGRPYDMPSNLKQALIVAGGVGVAPFPFLCEELLNSEIDVMVFLGARSKNELALVDFFRELNLELFLATEDGSAGHKGFITEPLLSKLSDSEEPAGKQLFSCGPNGFLNAMMKISAETGIRGQMAIETMMGCGFGICVGCAVRVREPKVGARKYRLACIEGPVFDALEIVLDG